MPRAGQQFTHKTMLDPNALPRRKAVMRITRVTTTAVYYTYADSETNKGLWKLDLQTWIDRYGGDNQ